MRVRVQPVTGFDVRVRQPSSTNARIGDIQAAMRELRLDMRAEHDTLRADIARGAQHDACGP